MAMVQSLDHYWTPEEVRALPDDGTRHECIDGLLIVTPAPNALHQRAVALLWDSLSPYVRRERIGELLPSPADIEIEPGTLVQTDLFIYRFLRRESRNATGPSLKSCCSRWRFFRRPRRGSTADSSADSISVRRPRNCGSWISTRESSNDGVRAMRALRYLRIASCGILSPLLTRCV